MNSPHKINGESISSISPRTVGANKPPASASHAVSLGQMCWPQRLRRCTVRPDCLLFTYLLCQNHVKLRGHGQDKTARNLCSSFTRFCVASHRVAGPCFQSHEATPVSFLSAASALLRITFPLRPRQTQKLQCGTQFLPPGEKRLGQPAPRCQGGESRPCRRTAISGS